MHKKIENTFSYERRNLNHQKKNKIGDQLRRKRIQEPDKQ